jgi:hypothetical protein
MRYLIALAVIVIFEGCSYLKTKNYQPPHPVVPIEEQARINAVNLCNSAGFTPKTEAYSNCLLSEMQRQLDQANFNKQQRKARIGEALEGLRRPVKTTNCRKNFGTVTCTTY